MNQKKSFYAIIPAPVRYAEGLNANAKLLYGEITALCHEQGFCWANNHYFAELYDVEKRTISRWISELEKMGFITSEIDAQKGNARKIFLADRYRQNCPEVRTKMSIGSGQNCPEGIDKNVPYNNTINNTSNNTEKEARALDFLKDNYPSRYESFKMQCEKKIKNFKKFCLDFNDVVDQEELKFSDKVLFARLNRYARNWIENESKRSGEEDTPRPYLKKIL